MAKKVVKASKVAKPESKKVTGKAVKAKGKVVGGVISQVDVADVAKVEKETISKTLEDLKKFIKKEESKEENSLISDESIGDIEIILNKSTPFNDKKSNPKLIFVNKDIPEDLKVCIFVRDGLIDEDTLSQIESSAISAKIGEIIPGSELKTTYKQYEKRRELYNKYDLFLCDDALITTLPKFLGKVFNRGIKTPVGIRIEKPIKVVSLVNQVQKVLKSVIYQLPNSKSLNILLGRSNEVDAQLIEQVLNHFKHYELKNVFIKSKTSPSLPLLESAEEYSVTTALPQESKTSKAIAESGENIKIDVYERGLAELQ